MASDSGTYDQATILRRQKIAEAMLGDAMKPRKIEHWAQGLAQMGQAGISGYLSNQANEEAKAARAAELENIAKMIGLSGSTPTAAPAPVAPSSAPVTSPVATAMSKVPAPTPPAPTVRAEVMPSGKVWGDKEAEAAGLYEPTTKPVKVASAPMAAPQAPVAQAMAPPQMPAPQPAASGSPLANASPQMKAAIVAGLGASEGSPARALGMAMLAQAMKPQEFGFQSQPDGTILRTNPRTGSVEPIYQGATKPTFGVIGEDAEGKKTYGFIDAAKGKVTPLEPAKPNETRPTVTGPDGKKIVIPEGVDVKKFRADVTSATADAATGKKTEVQGAAEQFANRLELAEKNFQGLEKEASGVSGVAQTVAGKVPVVGTFAQSEKFQKMEQAKSQFITALLRKESGAAIGKEEFNRYDKEFFPQPGNPPEVIAQKAEARRVAIEAMKKTAGPGYKSPTEGPPKARVTKTIAGKNYYQENGQWFEE